MPAAVRFRAALVALVLLAGLPLAACQRGGDASETSMGEASSSADVQMNYMVEPPKPGTGGVIDAPTDTVVAPAQRITTGSANVEVADVRAARARLLAATARVGGYVGEESETDDEGHERSATLVLRIPAGRAAGIGALLDSLGRVTSRSSEVEDVTAAYTDVAARLAARRAVEARYVALLQNARSVTDVVAVERSLQQVREEIESAEGQIRLWDRQVAYSTLTVEIEEPDAAVRDGVGSRVGDALRDGVALVEALLLTLIRLWPLLLVGLALWAWWRRRSRRGVHVDASPTPADPGPTP